MFLLYFEFSVSPNGPCSKGLVPSKVLSGAGGSLRGGPSGRSLGHWGGVSSKGIGIVGP
jgi:hypothetical protein